MPSLQTVIVLLSHYGYLLLFPLAIIEGPIVTALAAFLASEGYMNLFLIYPVVVAADMCGDFVFYGLGRWNISFINKYGRFLGINEEKLKKAKAYYSKHHIKSIVISKTIHGLGVVGLVAAGALKVPYFRFFRIALVVSIVQSAVFVVLGFFLGHAYMTISKYLNYGAALASILILVIISIIVFRNINKNE